MSQALAAEMLYELTRLFLRTLMQRPARRIVAAAQMFLSTSLVQTRLRLIVMPIGMGVLDDNSDPSHDADLTITSVKSTNTYVLIGTVAIVAVSVATATGTVLDTTGLVTDGLVIIVP